MSNVTPSKQMQILREKFQQIPMDEKQGNISL